jgi:hypothetical protein
LTSSRTEIGNGAFRLSRVPNLDASCTHQSRQLGYHTVAASSNKFRCTALDAVPASTVNAIHQLIMGLHGKHGRIQSFQIPSITTNLPICVPSSKTTVEIARCQMASLEGAGAKCRALERRRLLHLPSRPKSICVRLDASGVRQMPVRRLVEHRCRVRVDPQPRLWPNMGPTCIDMACSLAFVANE